MLNYTLVIAVSAILTLIVVNLLQKSLNKNDGKIVIDETNDSYYIVITTQPSKLCSKREITLTVHHIKKRN